MANPSELVQNEHIVAQFPIDLDEELCIRYFESDGEYYLDLRVFFRDHDLGGGWFTSHGFTVLAAHMPHLMAGLSRAEDLISNERLVAQPKSP